ncbi:MAG: site-specific DNA-methyltransferase [Phycisphaerales bacterium]|nr:site-specific DNA-methyltransferase [Phycisphaerales bacterium]
MPRSRSAPTAGTIARNGKRVAADSAEVDVVSPGSSTTKVKAGDTLTYVHSVTRVKATVHVGDCRDALRDPVKIPPGTFDLIFADPPFNWNRGYDKWNDALHVDEYLDFTFEWLELCVAALRPGGSLWVNIPDDWAAEIVCFLKGRKVSDTRSIGPGTLAMRNWCVWHYRFGQNTTERFINSKVHALYFIKGGGQHHWDPTDVLELSDRAAVYGDPRTLSKKDGMPPSMRVPMDVWYGKFWGRVQGNSKERRHYHDNQLPEVYLERVISACSKPGDLVLDPFLGSGTTGVVAHALNRRFVGCEFSPVNAQHALDRIKEGPIRPMGKARGLSSAIFPERKPQKSSKTFPDDR